MNLRFCGRKKIHDITVTTAGRNLVILHPPLPDNIDVTAGFELLTQKGEVYGNYLDFTTIYRETEDGTVILSNDGSVWEPPVPYIPTLEEVKAKKSKEISSFCELIIYSGIDVELPDGPAHFSLTEKDQINLFGKQAQLASGAEKVEYHQDGSPCRYFSVEEMQAIIATAMAHVSYHTTYCNSLNMWIRAAETTEEVEEIYYGADIPDQYQSVVLKDYIAAMMEQAADAIGDMEAKDNEGVS